MFVVVAWRCRCMIRGVCIIFARYFFIFCFRSGFGGSGVVRFGTIIGGYWCFLFDVFVSCLSVKKRRKKKERA